MIRRRVGKWEEKAGGTAERNNKDRREKKALKDPLRDIGIIKANPGSRMRICLDHVEYNPQFLVP